MKFRELTAASLFAASLAGCTLVASKPEYADYRAVRLAEGDRDRLVAMQRYVANNPEGHWYEAFQTERTSRESEVYEAGKTTREGLEFYLAAYPDGQFAEQARPRLAALSAVQGRRENEAERARETQAERLRQRQEQRRTWGSRAVTYWTRTLLSVQNWGSPIADVARGNPAFSRAFGENPRPRCTAAECDKFYQNAYAIPVPGATRIDRTIQIILRLKMEAGAVRGAELLLPARGFSRWYEMENRVAVVDEDPSQREQVIAWVLERLVPAITSTLTNAVAGESVTLAPVVPVAFTAEGTRTGTSTPGSGGTDAADETDGEDEEGEEQPAAAPTPAPAATPAAATSNVDALLAQASGTSAPAADVAQTAAAAPAPVAAEQASAPIAPNAVRVFNAPNLRVVVFTAGDDDYDTAYDGVSIELVEAAPAAAATPTPRGR